MELRGLKANRESIILISSLYDKKLKLNQKNQDYNLNLFVIKIKNYDSSSTQFHKIDIRHTYPIQNLNSYNPFDLQGKKFLPF